MSLEDLSSVRLRNSYCRHKTQNTRCREYETTNNEQSLQKPQ